MSEKLTKVSEFTAATTTEGILDKLQGVEADPTKIGGEYMPEVIPNVLLELADVSALGSALPLGTMGRNATGPVIGDGITVPGNQVGNPNTYRFVGTIELGDADVDIRRLLTLGTFAIPAAKAVVGGRLRWRGCMWGSSVGSNLGMKIGIAGSAGTLPVEGSGTPSSSQRFFGFALGTPDVETVTEVNIDAQMVFADSSGLLSLNDGKTINPAGYSTATISTVFARSLVNPSANSSAKCSTGVDGIMTLYFGSEINASTTGFRLFYDFEFTWE